MKKTIMLTASFFLLTVLSVFQSEGADRGKYGIGFQSTFPAWGLSGMVDINEEVSLQAILGPFGSLNTFAGRGLYRFNREDYWNAYCYGMMGFWTHTWRGGSYSTMGFGLGGGIELDWRVLNTELPPIFWNLELGLGFVNLEHYNFSALMVGIGFHYRF